MTRSVAVTDAQARLDRARANLDLLGQPGSSEKYLESYFLVEALELQLQRLLDEAPPAQA